MTYYLAAIDHTGYLRHLEEHRSFLTAFNRWRKLRNQFVLRSASLRLYVRHRETVLELAA